MKTSVGRLLTGMVALALLLGGFGLTQDSAQAQAPGTITVPNKYLCSLEDCTTTNSSGNITVHEADTVTTVEVLNLDVAKVSVPNPDFDANDVNETDPPTVSINPRTININSAITVVQEFTYPDADSDVPTVGQIRAFNGNRIQITFKPANGFATTAEILVDNVKPTLVETSPDIPLVVKGGVDVTFSADITDGGSGYTEDIGNPDPETGTGTDIDDLNGTPGPLDEADANNSNTVTPIGGVRLVVAGNVVALGKDDFEAIDGGWRVSKTLGSSAIQNIGANVPWYFETRDRAGNTRRSSGGIALKGNVVPGGSSTAGITDNRFVGGLPTTSFEDTKMKVTRGSASKTVGIESFNNGMFVLEFTNANFFTTGDNNTPDDATDDPVDTVKDDDKLELVGSNLMTIDSEAPTLTTPNAVTGIVYSTSANAAQGGLKAKANSIQVNFTDDGKDEGDKAGSGLDADSVTPSAFTVSDNTVNSVLVKGNSVYLTLETNLASDEQPSVNIARGVILDKAGNAFDGFRISKAADGLGPNLSLAEDADLSNEEVTITITTDEQLASLPDVDLSRVVSGDGAVVVHGAEECVYDAVSDPDGDPATDDALPKVVRDVSVADDGTVSCAAPTDADPALSTNYAATRDPSDVAGQPADAPNPSQTAALEYTYVVTTGSVPTELKDGDDVIVKGFGGKFNIYVTGVDTHSGAHDLGDNEGKAGHESDANHSAAFTFQIDTVLNGDVDPVVTVSDETATPDASDAPEVEAIDPMIVTVDWAGEAGEYPGDSYRTVELTSASLKISFSDGSSEEREFDLATEVSSQDNRKYTIPLLNPKVGTYTLTVEGTDSAGNESDTGGHSASWKVVSAKPVTVGLKPGWNLISLPFQPANPAINSVIPSDHPIGLVMTFDGAEGVWLFSRRNPDTDLFEGDVAVITASTAYFVNTDSFKGLSLLRPPSATAAAAPAQPPAISVSAGWNLVPVASTAVPTPKGHDADTYFGTLGSSWLRALAWDPLQRTWIAIAPDADARGLDPIGEGDTGNDRCGDSHDGPADDGDKDTNLTTTVGARVCTGEGLWLWVTEDGTLIPG